MASACTLGLLVTPLHGQDDSGAPSPPPDSGYQAPPSGNDATAPDDSSNASDSSASFQTFYDSLGSQGNWIQTGDYGYVWQPQVTDPDWAPYTVGHWVYTDDGWTWVSDEPWGWATYHYGRWVNLDGTGWCWVPGYTWAPAWVSWRYGGGYCGWAPLPPDSFVGIDYFGGGFGFGIGFHIGGDCDGFYGIGAGCYNFLPVNCLGYRNYHGYYYNRGNNYTIINRTTNVTNINVTKNGTVIGGSTRTSGGFHHVSAEGPSLSQVNAVSQTPVPHVNLVRTNQPGGGGLSGNSLSVYAPHVNPGTAGHPAYVSESIEHATINRGTDITRPLGVNARLVPPPATEAQVQQARIAQDNAPDRAKVATYRDKVNPILQTPLTSLQPMALVSPPHATSSSIERSPSTTVVAPATRTYPQTSPESGAHPESSSQSHVYYPQTATPSAPSYYYQPHSTSTGTAGGTSSPYVHPSAPTSYAPSSAAHPGSGGNSSASGGGGHAPSGGASHAAPSGGGGGRPQGH